LLDGHPELFVAPFEMHFFKHLDRKINYPVKRRMPDGRHFANSVISSIKQEILIANNYSDILPEAINEINIPFFEKYIKDNCKSNMGEKQKLQIYVSALIYACENKKLDSQTRLVEKSVENAEFAIDLYKMFPSAFFIHVIRNPYANSISLSKYQEIRLKDKRYLDMAVETLRQNYSAREKNKEIIPDYITLRYEDLLTGPGLVMRELAENIGITYEKSLLEPTSMNIPWPGNSISGSKFTGLDKDNLMAWRGVASESQITYINRYLGKYIKELGYDKH